MCSASAIEILCSSLYHLLPLTTFLSSAMWVRGHNDTSQHVGCITFLRKHIDKKEEKSMYFFTFWSNCEFILLNVESYGHNDTSRHATCYTLMYNRQACTFFFIECPICELSFFFRNTLIKKSRRACTFWSNVLQVIFSFLLQKHMMCRVLICRIIACPV